MSQVVKAIVATDTGDRKVITKGLSSLFTDVFQSKSDWHEVRDNENGVARIYRIGIKIGAQATVTDYEYMRDVDALSEAVKRTKRQVIEGIFGEFRPHLRMIEKAIYNHDMEEAGRLLHEMEHIMFEEYE